MKIHNSVLVPHVPQWQHFDVISCTSLIVSYRRCVVNVSLCILMIFVSNNVRKTQITRLIKPLNMTYSVKITKTLHISAHSHCLTKISPFPFRCFSFTVSTHLCAVPVCKSLCADHSCHRSCYPLHRASQLALRYVVYETLGTCCNDIIGIIPSYHPIVVCYCCANI